LNRLNPLHLIILLLVIIVFLFFQLSSVKNELQEEKVAYHKSELIAKELLSYKKLYGDKKRIERSLKKILSQRSLKKANLQIEKKRDGMKISAKAIDLYALNSLMTKLFNGAYLIKSIEIKAIDDKTAKLKLEITW